MLFLVTLALGVLLGVVVFTILERNLDEPDELHGLGSASLSSLAAEDAEPAPELDVEAPPTLVAPRAAGAPPTRPSSLGRADSPDSPSTAESADAGRAPELAAVRPVAPDDSAAARSAGTQGRPRAAHRAAAATPLPDAAAPSATPREHTALRTKVSAAALLEDPLAVELLERLERGTLTLPRPSSSIGRLLALCLEPEAPSEVVTETLELDSALAEQVLHTLAAPPYGDGSTLRSLKLAAMRCGLETVREVAITITVRERVLLVRGDARRVHELWRHAAVAGAYAREIAWMRELDPNVAGLIALLQNMGEPALIPAVRDLERELDHELPPELFGPLLQEFHARAGGLLIQAWSLPARIRAAVEHHHAPEEAGDYVQDALLCCTAGALATWALEAQPGDGPAEEDPTLKKLGLPVHELRNLAAMRARIVERAAAFS